MQRPDQVGGEHEAALEHRYHQQRREPARRDLGGELLEAAARWPRTRRSPQPCSSPFRSAPSGSVSVVVRVSPPLVPPGKAVEDRAGRRSGRLDGAAHRRRLCSVTRPRWGNAADGRDACKRASSSGRCEMISSRSLTRSSRSAMYQSFFRSRDVSTGGNRLSSVGRGGHRAPAARRVETEKPVHTSPPQSSSIDRRRCPL